MGQQKFGWCSGGQFADSTIANRLGFHHHHRCRKTALDLLQPFVTGITRGTDGCPFFCAVWKFVQTTEPWFSHSWSLFSNIWPFAGQCWYHGYWLAWVENCCIWSQLVPFSNRTTRGNSTFLCVAPSSAQKSSQCSIRYAASTSKGSAWHKPVRSDSFNACSRAILLSSSVKPVWQLASCITQTVNHFLLRDLNLAKELGMIMSLGGFSTMAPPLARMNAV